MRATAGTAPRPRSAEGKRIERAVTIATVLEFATAIVLPVIFSSAGHSDAAEVGHVRIASGRASDFVGAGITTGTTLGERVFANALAGNARRLHRQPRPTAHHTYSYVPDIAIGLATLGTDARAVGGVWHLPSPETVTTRQLLNLLAEDVGHPVGMRNLPKLAVRAFGLFNPLLRELVEMSYEFDESFVLDTTNTRPPSVARGRRSRLRSRPRSWYRSRNPSRPRPTARAERRHAHIARPRGSANSPTQPPASRSYSRQTARDGEGGRHSLWVRLP